MIPIICVVVLVAIDQIVKHSVTVDLASNPITLIPKVLELTYLENRGAAFGIMQDKSIFLIGMPIIILVGLVWFYKSMGSSKGDKISKIALVLVIAGAIGNLIDRVLNGFVVDMFNFLFIEFPVFNMADIFVVIGTSILVIASFLISENKEENNG